MRWRGCDWLGAPCSALQAHCQYLVLASRDNTEVTGSWDGAVE